MVAHLHRRSAPPLITVTRAAAELPGRARRESHAASSSRPHRPSSRRSPSSARRRSAAARPTRPSRPSGRRWPRASTTSTSRPRTETPRCVVGPHVPAVRDRLFVAGKSDRSNPDGVRAHLERTLERSGLRPPRPLPAPRRHRPRRPRAAGRRRPRSSSRARDEGLTRFVGITGHDLGTPRGPARGAAPLRPGHRDVPRLPAGLGRSGLPRRRRGAAGRVRGPRRRRDGHQGGGPPALGRRRGRRRPRGTSRTPTPTRDRPRHPRSRCPRPASTRSARRATSACCPWPWTPPRGWRRLDADAATPRWPRPPDEEVIFPLAREGAAGRADREARPRRVGGSGASGGAGWRPRPVPRSAARPCGPC